jgi:iron complex outermembrane receptor protein
MVLFKGLMTTTCCVAALVALPAQAKAQSLDTGTSNTGVSDVTQDGQTAIGDPVASAKLAADTARTSEREGSDIVVTGTRIQRPNNRSAAPIVTTTAAEIAAQGATTIEEVLNRLPQVQVTRSRISAIPKVASGSSCVA